MKKLLVILTLTSAAIISISSCSKCYTCDFGNGDVRDYCAKDFPDKKDGLKLTIDAYEAQGYKCSSK